MPSPLRALVFDFDGTLARLTIDFELMKRKIAALASGFLPECVTPDGHPVLELVELFGERVREAEGDETALEFRSRARLVITATELDAARTACLFPGTRAMLAELHALGLATGIITRNCTAAVKRVYPAVERECGVFIAREDAPKVKPDPAHLLAALDRLGVEPGRSLMVGDHPMDIETGKRAGTLTAGVASGNTTREALREAGADLVAGDCAELLPLLRGRGLLG